MSGDGTGDDGPTGLGPRASGLGPVFSWFWFSGQVRGDRPGQGAYAGFPWDGAEVFGPYMSIAMAERGAAQRGGRAVRLVGHLKRGSRVANGESGREA